MNGYIDFKKDQLNENQSIQVNIDLMSVIDLDTIQLTSLFDKVIKNNNLIIKNNYFLTLKYHNSTLEINL